MRRLVEDLLSGVTARLEGDNQMLEEVTMSYIFFENSVKTGGSSSLRY